MLHKALKGGPAYWGFLGLCALLAGAGGAVYVFRIDLGGGLTGLTRDVIWGLNIAQFTFMVGVAASAVLVVLPYYLHDYKLFARVVILGECLAIAAVTISQVFIFLDVGRPERIMNVMFFPRPNSLIFWDLVVLPGYLFLNLAIAAVTFSAESQGAPPPRWIRPVIIVSIFWAISIHTVTAFLFCGLNARPAWLNPLMAPRFLASAFASGPAVLVLLCLAARRFARYDVGAEALGKLAQIVVYALAAYLFLFGCEAFTTLYGDIPEQAGHLKHLYFHGEFAPMACLSLLLAAACFAVLLCPAVRRSPGALAAVCLGVVFAIWLEKGLILVISGFQPSPLGHEARYAPTASEIAINVGVYALGALILAVLFKVVTAVRAGLEQGSVAPEK